VPGSRRSKAGRASGPMRSSIRVWRWKLRGPRAAPRPEPGVRLAEAGLQRPRHLEPVADELPEGDGRADHLGEEGGQPFRRVDLVPERGRVAQADTGRARSRAGQADPGEGRGQRAEAAAARALGLDLGAVVGPGAVVERHRPVLQHVGEIGEGVGGVVRGSAVARWSRTGRGSRPPPACQRWLRRSSTQRVMWSGSGPSGPIRPIAAMLTRAGPPLGGAAERLDVRRREAEADRLAEPRRLALGAAGPAEAPPVPLEPPQEGEESPRRLPPDAAPRRPARRRAPPPSPPEPRSDQAAVAGRHRPCHLLLSLHETGPGPDEGVDRGVPGEEAREQRREQEHRPAGEQRLVDVERDLGAAAEADRPAIARRSVTGREAIRVIERTWRASAGSPRSA
jgi:hypothetical protein